jgi:hypothetical protein
MNSETNVAYGSGTAESGATKQSLSLGLFSKSLSFLLITEAQQRAQKVKLMDLPSSLCFAVGTTKERTFFNYEFLSTLQVCRDSETLSPLSMRYASDVALEILQF